MNTIRRFCKLHSTLLSIVLLLICVSPFTANSQSSNLDVLHYDLSISDFNFSAKTINAVAIVAITADGLPVDTIPLDLLKLTIDSIWYNSSNITFLYNDTTILIPLLVALNQGDTSMVTVFYHGAPVADATWGGFKFSNPYAYNMGVGFSADPHNFGKVWFPCHDNFTDRAFYDFHITTPSNDKAFCNGTLISQVTNPNSTITWNWQMNDRIPTYLASIAVAPYVTWQRNFSNIPVEIACLANDTVAVNGTFQHLDSVLSHYIQAYGPYPYDKVGFCLVPFSGGAMEHASSIHVGKPFINGTLTYETLWAHELSHMWWGDKVTCETEGDMWLNEGFASFNEAFTTEVLYGKTAYRNWNRTAHRKVLQFTHINDGGYYPLINIPHNITYGETVYNKGADIARTIRGYMGDSAFFNGCQYYLNNRNDNSANSNDLKSDLTQSSGIDMTQFFDDWVYTPGFPHFSIDSIVYFPGGLDHYFVYTKQKSKGNNHLYKMNVEITFSGNNIDTTVTVLIDSATNVFHIPIFFAAEWISLDRFDKMADAISDYEQKITSTGVISFPETNVSLNVQTLGIDTSLIRIEHNWVAPDSFLTSNPYIVLSDYHYWTVNGFFQTGFLSKATFSYNGSNSLSTGHIDNSLISGNEDSLVILYRDGAGSNWEIVPGFTLLKGVNSTDKIGTIVVDTLKRGEYCLGYYHYVTGINTLSDPKVQYLRVWPNPSSDSFNISIANVKAKKLMIFIYDLNGKNIYAKEVNPDMQFIWQPKNIPAGEYLIRLFDGKKEYSSTKVTYLK